MSIFSNLFNKKSERATQIVVGHTDTVVKQIYDNINFSGFNFNPDLINNISTVYTCCKILAEDVGSFPIKIYQNDDEGGKDVLKDDYRYFLLHRDPNNYTSHYDFFAALEYVRNIKGNSFAKINRDPNGSVKSFSIINPDLIEKAKVVNEELYYWYKTEEDWINSKEFLHFRMLTTDGIFGINPIEKLRLNLSITAKAFSTIDNFYENGAITTKALERTIPEGINPKDWIKSQEDFESKYKGYSKANKVVFLPEFTKLVDIPLNIQDIAFIDTIKFNANQIAALYKISPHLIGNYESSKFNNLKELQLGYKINTLRPILRMYREELERKLLTPQEIVDGISIEFNTNALVETDSKERIANYKDLFSMGAITPNQICKYEGYPTFNQGGDEHFILTQLMSIENYINKNKQANTSNENKI